MRLLWNVSRIAILTIIQSAAMLFAASYVYAVEMAPRTETPLLLSFEERTVLAYLLAGVGKSDEEKLKFADQLEKQVREASAKPARTVEVHRFADFARHFQGSWPNSYSVTSDIELIEQRRLRAPLTVKGANNEIQSQINLFHFNRVAELTKRLGPTITGLEFKMVAGTLFQFFFAPKRDLILRAFRETEVLVEQEFAKIEGIGDEISKTDKLKGVSPEMRTFLTLIFQEYFAKMSIETKALVLVRLMGEDLNLDPMKKFEIMILSGGPQFQKLLQIVARESNMSADLLEIFRKLESKAPSVPPMIVQDMIERERGTYQWMDYDLKPLGVGTMAQVHKGRIRTAQGRRDVVIRFLKPRIEQRVDEDHRILTLIAPKLDAHPVLRQGGFPLLAPIVSDLTKTVREELSLRETIVRQLKGREVYTTRGFFEGSTYKNTLDISVPEIFDYDRNSLLMVSDLIKGKKLDSVAEDYKDSIPDLKRGVVEQIARVWLEELLFKSGFFHADMHQGNFMVDVSETGLKVNILDFGMGGTISAQLQKQLLLLGAGIEILKPSAITRALWDMSDKNRNGLNFTQLETAVNALAKEMDQGRHPLWGISDWSTWAMERGLQFPYEFIGMNRGLAILDKLLQDSGSKMRMSNLSKRLANRYSKQVWHNLRASGEMTISDLLRLGWVSVMDASPASVHYKPPGEGPTRSQKSAVLAPKCSRVMMPAGVSL
ncbi:MAG: AarF/UbiB family protein [Bdellovibrio sp.]